MSLTRDNVAPQKMTDLIRPQTIDSSETYCLRPVSSLKETKFHRGFHRRMLPHADDIRNKILDDAWLCHEARIARATEAARSRKENIVYGPVIREQPRSRKRMLGPHTFDESRKVEAQKRITDSSFRFFSPTNGEPKPLIVDPRAASAIIGYHTNPRNRTRSVGIYDNFSHTQLQLDPVPISTPSNRNKSQITLY